MTDTTYVQQLRKTILGEFYFGAMCHETKRRIAISPVAARASYSPSTAPTDSGRITRRVPFGLAAARVSSCYLWSRWLGR